MEFRKEDFCVTKSYAAYVPHGIDESIFYPIDRNSPEYEKLIQYKKEKLGIDDSINYIIFFNSRNMRRKSAADLILAFRYFCDLLSEEEAKKCMLLLHTQPIDENGSDLFAVVKALCPMYNVKFSTEKISPIELNYLYNIVSVTVSIGSNEGWGLSSTESIMAGTVIINNVTGGLQDQVRFEDENGKWIDFTNDFPSNHTGRYKKYGSWAKAIFPSNRSIQGSVPTPYIFDDRVCAEDVADAIKYWYETSIDDRKKFGLEGRAWLLSSEANMSAKSMGNNMIKHIDSLFKTFTSKPKFFLYRTDYKEPIITNPGILKSK